VEIILLDGTKAAHVLHIDVLKRNAEYIKNPPATKFSKVDSITKQNKPTRLSYEVVKVHKVQVIDCAQIEIKVMYFSPSLLSQSLCNHVRFIGYSIC
jgi:hypothetical protein